MATTKVDVNLISATGTPGSGNFLRGDGTWQAITSGYTIGTEVATTSGTAATFTGIPAGTKSIIMNIAGFSQATANGDIVCRIGDSGGIETSGYISTGAQLYNSTVSSTDGETTGFVLSGYADFDAAKIMSGSVYLALQDAANFTWCAISLFTGAAGSPTHQMFVNAGEKPLSAELTQISLTTVGGFTFDAGGVNILYM